MTELHVLALSIVLGFVHIMAQARAATMQRGYRWNASARDEPVPPLTRVGGRLGRASRNFMETFPFFAAAVLMVVVAQRTSDWSLWGAYLYLGARIAYLFAYASGIFFVRSVIWTVATAGIFMILYSYVR